MCHNWNPPKKKSFSASSCSNMNDLCGFRQAGNESLEFCLRLVNEERAYCSDLSLKCWLLKTWKSKCFIAGQPRKYGLNSSKLENVILLFFPWNICIYCWQWRYFLFLTSQQICLSSKFSSSKVLTRIKMVENSHSCTAILQWGSFRSLGATCSPEDPEKIRELNKFILFLSICFPHNQQYGHNCSYMFSLTFWNVFNFGFWFMLLHNYKSLKKLEYIETACLGFFFF